jgi:hypothetical protein
MDDAPLLAPLIDFRLEHLFSFTARVQPPQLIGDSGEGLRAIFLVVDGEVTGPRVRGQILGGSGGDWLTLRSDGIQVVDVRGTLRTDDGALIYGAYTGVGDLGEDGYANQLKGIVPERVPIRATARYQCGHPAYRWLNRLQCLHIGEADVKNRCLRYDVYAVR